MRPLCVMLSLLLLPLTSPAGAATTSGAVHWSFEDRTLQGWRVTEGSIETPVACRPNLWFHPLRINKEGECFLSTFEATGVLGEAQAWYRGQFGDGNRGLTGQGLSTSRGVIESPRFTLTHPTVSMLVGGGAGPDTYVAVCAVEALAVDGCRELARIHGDDSEWFAHKAAHLPEEIGNEVFLRVVDDATVTGWSHLVIDDIRANAPAMPRSLRTLRTDDGVGQLSWAAVEEPGIVGYEIRRATRGEESPWPAAWGAGPAPDFSPLATVTEPSFTDLTAEADEAYWYAVAALEDTGVRSEANITHLPAVLTPSLTEAGQPTVYAAERLDGIAYPVGPIGYGGVLHLGDGTRNLAWIFNIDGWLTNSTWNRRAARVPHSFFAVRAEQAGGHPVVRALQTVAEGPFAPVAELTFAAEEPVGTYRFADAELPVTISLSAESPTVPGDLRDSAIPTVIYTAEVTNPADRPVAVSLLASQQNAVGYDAQVRSGGIAGRRHPGYGTNSNQVTTDDRGAHLQMTGCTEGHVAPVGLRCNGGLALSLLDPAASGTASWTSFSALHEEFSSSGTVTGPATASSPEREVTVDGALTTSFELAAGETRTVPIVFSWYIPTSAPREFGGLGVAYANTWASAREVHAEVLDRLSELRDRNRLLRDTLHDSTLPRYVIERLTSQLSTMRTPTVFSAQNGFLGGYEGHGCCAGMPSHVWQYAQLAPRLWPEIDMAWQSQWLDLQAPDGSLPNRHAIPVASFDGQAGVILGSYRTWRSTADRDWLTAYWPRISAAMDYLVRTHDPDEDGILTGSQAMTLDQRLSGTSSWLGSLYLAAAAATSRMAAEVGDAGDAERYATLAVVGGANQEALLWNGRYYGEASEGHVVSGPDLTATATGTATYGNAVMADMLLGQWWATQLGLGDLYDSDNMTTAMRVLFEENFTTDFLRDSPFGHQVWRAYTRPDDAGLQMMTWPDDDRPIDPPRYHDEVWTGTEYSAAATMIQRGLLEEGLRIVRSTADRHDGQLRRDMFLWNCGALDGGGNPFGDDECGKWYARAMSVWSVLLALQGFTYDAGERTIGFAPRWRPEDHRSFFSAGEAWGTFDQRRDGSTQVDTLLVRSGSVELQRVDLDTGDVPVDRVEVTHNDRPIHGVRVLSDGSLPGAVSVDLPESVTLAAGDILVVTLTTS